MAREFLARVPPKDAGSSPPPRRGARRGERRGWRLPWRSLKRWQKGLVIGGGVLALLIVGIAIADSILERRLPGIMERQMNAKLEGYTARVADAKLHFFGLALNLRNVAISQNAHPDPPVLEIPDLKASVNWKALLFGRLVADFVFNSPSVYANFAQLQTEAKDKVSLREHGWQEAFQAIYPLKINELRILDGSLVYKDTSGFKPLHATHIELVATNIRNIRSKDRTYPSSLQAHGVLFDKGSFTLDGNADFLAKPMPGVKMVLSVKDAQLDYLEPVLQRYDLKVRKGLLDAQGLVEYGSNVQIVDIDSITIRDAAVDYIYTAAPNERVEQAAQTIKTKAKQVMNDSSSLFRIRSLKMANGTVGFVNRGGKPGYRVFISNANMTAENLSSRAQDGIGKVEIKGSFMGTGDVGASAAFYPEGKEANFGAKLKIAETQIVPMNDVLRTHGGFDVARGVFSLYVDVRVRDGYINGYVKPMFRDLDVYNKEQDKHKNPFRKMYEAIVGGVAKMLENRKRDEVATVASISGPVENPKSSAMEVIGGLIRNGFFKSILPGFEGEYRRIDPLQYRRIKKHSQEPKSEAKSSDKS
jgi:hypothetical protein